MARAKRSLSIGDMEEPGTDIDFFGSSFETPFEANDKKTLEELEEYEMQYIPIDKIVDNKENDYRAKTIEEMEALEESIWLVGVLEPISVIRETDADGQETGKYEIKAGSQRYACVSKLYNRAVFEKDEAKRIKFSKIPAIIVPRGATEEEIQRVYHDTNNLARHLTVDEMFKHYDYIFGYKDGVYTKLNNVVNKAEHVVTTMKSFGLVCSLSKAKKYNIIYFAHNSLIKEYFRKGIINMNQAFFIASQSNLQQDKIMNELPMMDRKNYRNYFKVLQIELEGAKDKNYTGHDIIMQVKSFRDKTRKLTPQKIVFASNDEKKELKNYLTSLEADIIQLRQLLK